MKVRIEKKDDRDRMKGQDEGKNRKEENRTG